MNSYWCICINASGTKWLKEGMKYLIEPRGTKAKILRDEDNPHRKYNSVNKNRFKQVQLWNMNTQHGVQYSLS